MRGHGGQGTDSACLTEVGSLSQTTFLKASQRAQNEDQVITAWNRS